MEQWFSANSFSLVSSICVRSLLSRFYRKCAWGSVGFFRHSFVSLLATSLLLLSGHLWQAAALLTCLGRCFVSAGLSVSFQRAVMEQMSEFPIIHCSRPLLRVNFWNSSQTLCESVLRSLSPCAETVTPRLFVSCGQRVDRLHQRAPVKPARGRGYDGGRWFLHSECCLGNHSSENGRFVRKIFLWFTIRLNCRKN